MKNFIIILLLFFTACTTKQTLKIQPEKRQKQEEIEWSSKDAKLLAEQIFRQLEVDGISQRANIRFDKIVNYSDLDINLSSIEKFIEKAAPDFRDELETYNGKISVKIEPKEKAALIIFEVNILDNKGKAVTYFTKKIMKFY